MRPDGSPLHVVSSGREGSDVETFLLLHGFGATHYTWRHWVPRLEERGRVVRVDLKGFGASEKPDDGRYGPLVQAALVEELIAHIAPGPLTLVGHSFGGSVALLTAVALAPRGALARLVVVAGAAYPQRLPPFVRLARTPRLCAAALRVIGARRVIRHALRAIVHDPGVVDAEQVAAYAAPLGGPGGLRAALDAARQIVPDGLDRITALYPTVDVPALLVWGREDRVVPVRVGERLARELPNARLVVMERCGHMPHEERPSESLRILESFLDA